MRKIVFSSISDKILFNKETQKLERVVKYSYKNKHLNFFKTDEDGISYCRNLYYSPLAHYTLCFPGEYNNWYYDIEAVEDYAPFKYNFDFPSNLELSQKEEKIILSSYPSFSYLLTKLKNKNLYTKSYIFEVLTIWKKFPKIELLLAEGFFKVAFSKQFYKLSLNTQKSIIKLLLKQKKNYSIKECLLVLKAQKKFNLKDSEIDSFISFCQCKRFKNCFDFETFRYLNKNNLCSYCGFSLYEDYLYMLKITNRNENDPYWKFPKNLKEKHDLLSDEIEREKELEDKEKNRIKQEKYFSVISPLLKYNNFNFEGYEIYIPKKIKDVQFQADNLHQCLISCDYVSRVINKGCVLVFIRKKGKPIATVEVKKNNVIGQFYLDEKDRNNCMPSDELRTIFSSWLKNKNIA